MNKEKKRRPQDQRDFPQERERKGTHEAGKRVRKELRNREFPCKENYHHILNIRFRERRGKRL